MSPPSELTCNEIVDEVLKGGAAMERMTLRVLDSYKGYIKTIGAKNNVPYEVAADAYSEAVTQLISQISSGKFVQKFEKSCSTYIYSITHNKCVDYIRKKVRSIDIDYINDSEDPNKYEPTIEAERIRLKDVLDRYRGKLGETCRVILELFAKGYKPKEIADKLGMASANSVSATKSKCIKDLRKLIEEENDEIIW